MLVRALSNSDAEEIGRWRYPGRYATYDVGETPTTRVNLRAVVDGDELIGYCCFGPEARVPGVAAEDGVLDLGYGIRPDLMGQGHGRAFVATILDFVAEEFSPGSIRLVILDWNRRSRRVASAHGFEQRGVVPSAEGRFVVMMRP